MITGSASYAALPVAAQALRVNLPQSAWDAAVAREDQERARDMPGPVTLRVRMQGEPTARSALGRLVTSVPALVLLVLLSFLASAVWILCALSILWRETASVALREFLRLTLSYQFRLIAYHLSLVDRYPSLGDAAVRAESEPRPV